jgi:hypothetical protein
LAVNVYKLKVLTMTYDNGLFSKLALDNISRAIEITGVKNIFCKPDFALQKKIYQDMFRHTGDICGACDIATNAWQIVCLTNRMSKTTDKPTNEKNTELTTDVWHKSG